MNQICSHPIIDCSLHLDKSYSRDGEGDRGIETERARERELGMGVKVWPSHRLNLSFRQITLFKEQSAIVLSSNFQTFYG